MGSIHWLFAAKRRFCAGAFVALSVLAGCGGVLPAAGPPTAIVSRGDLIQTVVASGTTLASGQAKLGFKVPGKIASINVAVGDTVATGQVLAELDSSDARAVLHQAQASDDAARAGLDLAQAKVQQLVQSAKPDNIAQANAQLDSAQQKLALAETGARAEQVQQAQASLQQAQARLESLQNGPRPEQVAVLQSQLDAARNALYAAQTSRDGACNPRNPDYVCSSAKAQVAAAENGIDTAQRQLTLATAPPMATDLQQAQAAVIQAQAQLNLLKANTPQDIQSARDAVTQSQAAAHLAAQPFTDADMAAVQAAVKQTQAQITQADAVLEAAKVNVDNTRLVAPSPGKVLQLNNVAGEIVSAANVPVVLGVGGLVVSVGLPENSFSQVKPGQPSEVTFDSLPGKTYGGKVSDLPSAGTAAQNLVSYVVTVSLDQSDDNVRPDMAARVTIRTLDRHGVLLVPNAAVQSYQGKNIVLTPSATQPARVEVQLGASDGHTTEVLGGIAEGQQVLLTARPFSASS